MHRLHLIRICPSNSCSCCMSTTHKCQSNIMGLIGNVLLSFALLRQRGAQVSLRHNRHMPTSAKLLPHLSLIYCTMSMSNRPTIYQRISSKFQRKSSANGNPLSNEPARDCQSLALDNAKMIFQLASNLGSGALNVPGLQAAGLIGAQIIDAIKVSIIIYFYFLTRQNFIYRNSNLISRMQKIS